MHQLGTLANPAQRICDSCLDWHNRAIEFLAGRELAPGCQECGVTWEILRDRDKTVENISMFVVPRDGIYQILCRDCVRPYTQKRADLYAGTGFGRAALNL